jgi:hypothetical protein
VFVLFATVSDRLDLGWIGEDAMRIDDMTEILDFLPCKLALAEVCIEAVLLEDLEDRLEVCQVFLTRFAEDCCNQNKHSATEKKNATATEERKRGGRSWRIYMQPGRSEKKRASGRAKDVNKRNGAQRGGERV